ncbi:MAG TPA: Ig-like domain repeat protein [Candidatus Solibacter sp.]|nr:Ig-like domain repeat protein [Candidatus Solibacter sp.]
MRLASASFQPSSVLRSALLVSAVAALLLSSLTLAAGAQDATGAETQIRQPLIRQPIDESQLTTLKGNTHPLARPEFDLGTASADLPTKRMLLVLTRSPEQEAELAKLLDDQQDKSSPNYHKWLTPEQFGKQFGPGDADLQTITAWLQSHGFEVGSTKGRTVLEFSGTAGQVQEAFHTSIHQYLVSGEQHWANASDPQIPTALAGAVAGVDSLNNFPRKAMNVPGGTYERDEKTGRIHAVRPLLTFPGNCNQIQECYGVTPYDFATIYNELPLWNAGITGAGVTIAIVGETDIQLSDVQSFRSYFGLPANDPTFIWNGPDPGIQGDESEADIDVQWSGGAAPGASIDFVISESTETTAGIDLSAVYIVEQNLAPIMSESYGLCELGLGTAGNAFYNALWQQASAQGITVFISAGDNGSAGCDDFNAYRPAAAKYGLQVSGFASTPYNVAVGGTDFNDFTTSSNYWNTTNNPTTQQSAKSYIPETTWNDSCTNAIFGTIGFSTNAETNCNNSQLVGFVIPEGGSGGSSTCTTNSQQLGTCSGGYPRPSWQTGSGTFSTDGKRDIPDVSLFASNGFVGNAYLICEADQPDGDCPYGFLGFGGTSVSSPAFAGIMALVVQKTGERQGNANYVFYKLAAKSGASCTSSSTEASSCIFNDVNTGTIAMPCKKGSPNCTTNTSSDTYGVMTGYSAGAGYDLATGLGSVNVNNLVNQWTTVSSLPTTTTLNSLNPTTITHGQAVNFTVTVKPESGSGTPTGQISLEGSPTSDTQGIAGFNLSSGTATGSTELLPGGSYSVIAHYAGDSTYGPSDSSPISVTVGKENSQSQVFLVTFNTSGQLLSNNATTAMYASPYLLRVNVENSAGALCSPTGSTATGCPSGNITLTDNGSALDLGTYSLNSFGYFEDQLIQLTGGTHAVKAAYPGDNSFNSSVATNTITITPAPTSITNLFVGPAAVGQPVSITAYVNTTSYGAAPSGTVSFYANGTALNGTVSYNRLAGFPGFYAYTQATLTSDSNAFPAAGTYNITATYNADANYSTSTSGADTISVIYPRPTVNVTPYSQTVSYGNTANVTALIDTANKTVYPTGTVTFVDGATNATLAGPIACANAKDSSGYYACQAVATFTVTSNGSFNVMYSGDSNFPAATNYGYIVMPDFNFSASGWVQVTAGQSQNLTITFNSVNGLSGTAANFSCSNLPAETTCSFNPSQVTLPSNGSVSTTLTVTTTAIGQSQKGLNGLRATNWGIAGSMMLLACCLIATPFSRGRAGRGAVALMLVAAIAVLPGCGGGGSGGGGGPKNPVPSITSLNPTQVAAGSQINSLYVNGTNFMGTSTVTYNGTLHNSSLQSSTQIQIALGPDDVASTGSYPVVVSNPAPGGGPSAPMNFAVVTGTPTGYFTANMNATIGPITHSAQLSMNIQ